MVYTLKHFHIRILIFAQIHLATFSKISGWHKQQTPKIMEKFIKIEKDKTREAMRRNEKSWQSIVLINDLTMYLNFLVGKTKEQRWGPDSYFHRGLLMSVFQEEQSFVSIANSNSIHPFTGAL